MWGLATPNASEWDSGRRVACPTPFDESLHRDATRVLAHLVGVVPTAEKGSVMKKKHYDKEPSAVELAAMPGEDIDCSDIPELGEAFWKTARVVDRDRTTPVTLRVKEPALLLSLS
jgi:hypothetical protein